MGTMTKVGGAAITLSFSIWSDGSVPWLHHAACRETAGCTSAVQDMRPCSFARLEGCLRWIDLAQHCFFVPIGI